MRRLIKHYFKERDCLTIVRPYEQEIDIQNIGNFEFTTLR